MTHMLQTQQANILQSDEMRKKYIFLKHTDGFYSYSLRIMAARSDLLLPLALVCSLLIRSFSALPASSGVHPAGGPPQPPATEDPFLTSEDYSVDQYPLSTHVPDTPPPARSRPLERCDYNPCMENQTSCQLQEANRQCLCPGFTLPDQAPLPPALRSLAWNGSQVVVRWCAPYSHVTGYLVTVGRAKRGQFGMGQRSGGLGAVDYLTEVCLSAVNEAGVSKAACQVYRNDGHGGLRPLTLGLVGGTLVLLLLSLLAVLLWRRRRQRKQRGGRRQ